MKLRKDLRRQSSLIILRVKNQMILEWFQKCYPDQRQRNELLLANLLVHTAELKKSMKMYSSKLDEILANKRRSESFVT